METLESRIRKKGDKDIGDIDLFIGGKKKPCAKLNEEYIFKQLTGKLYKIKSINFTPSKENFKPKVDEKDGTIGTSSFQDVLFLRIGAKIMVIHNVDTLDSITNGQIGVLIDVLMTKDDKIDKLVVKLDFKRAGKMNRLKYPLLASKYPECVFLEKVSFQYNVRRNSGEVGFAATVVQFPVKVAFASTAHKFQGATVPTPATVLMDLNSTFEPGQCYVMLSRIQQLGKLSNG